MSGSSQIENGASFFRNDACPYFPCHAGVPAEQFNCLFCYCPLYALGPRCGGDYSYTASGIKDCSGCTRLHRGDQGAHIVKEQFSQLAELARADGFVSQTQYEAHNRPQETNTCTDDERDATEGKGTSGESIAHPATPTTTSTRQTAPLTTTDKSNAAEHVS